MSHDAQATNLSFEDALGKLESIVETMEGGELPLEQLLARYEEGTRLVAFCQEKLAAAELRLQQLDPRAAGDAGPSPCAEPDPAALA
jgi:exodeoxyribonuclease VII small subunit